MVHTRRPRKHLLAFLLVAVPWAATAQDPERWPEQGLEVQVDAPGPWLASVERLVAVRVWEAPTPLSLRAAGGALVEVEVAREGAPPVLASARADAQGRALARIVLPEAPGAANVTVRARRGDAGTVVHQEATIEDPRVALVHTDRALYEPGDEVGIRLLVARRPDLHPRRDEPIDLVVLAAGGEPVLETRLSTSRYGIAASALTLGPRARTGTYQVLARVDGAAIGTASFLVAHRAMPRFRVELTPDHRYLAPGATLGLHVLGTYLHGPPVAGGVARILDGAGVELGRAILDRSGAADVPLTAPPALGAFALRADVRAPDGTTAAATASVAVDPEPIRLTVEPEGGSLAPGLANRVHVRVERPDGSPVAGTVSVTTATHALHATLDAAGQAELVVEAGDDALEHASGPCASAMGWVATIRVEPAGDARWEAERCLGVDPDLGLLLRTTAAEVTRDAPVAVEVLAPAGAQGIVAEAFWHGAPVARTPLRREGASWRGALALPAGLVGPVALLAEARTARGAPLSSASRPIRVRPESLDVRIEGAGETRRPRTEASLTVKVRDGAGRPVQAALGMAIVDEAAELAAAMPERPPAAEEMTGTDAGEPPAPSPWSDPEEERRVLLQETVPSIFRAVEARLAEGGVEQVGIYDDGRWRFRRELLRVLVENGSVSGSLEGMGGRELAMSDVEAYDPSFRFDGVAARITRSRLVQLLVQLRDAALARGADLSLRPPLDIAAMREGLGVEDDGDDGVVATHELDGWGRPLFVRRTARPRFVLSRALDGWEIGSPGPDGIVGNGDDLVDPLRASVPRTSPYGLAVGEPGGGPELAANLLASEMLDALATQVTTMGSGMSGTGFGSGMGSMNARLGAAPSVRSGSAMVRGGAAAPAVRDRFPKTLVWLPELVTDAAGEATIPVELADSLTTWKVRLVASSLDGGLGEATEQIVVSQPLFVDVSAPPAWTAGDRIAVPVAVHNNSGAPAEVVLRVEARGALSLDESPDALLHVDDGGVALHRVAVRATRAGAGSLRVTAVTPGESDAAERSVTVLSAAREAVAGKSGVLEGSTKVSITVPAHALAGTASLQVRVHGGFASVAIDGLESLLREPNGCFEQTSSATYPNVLILGHLRNTGDAAVLEKARGLVKRGYDRLRAYEVRGGGFSWFGDAPANLILTAYGLREFTDMAAVREVDGAMLARTRDHLFRLQHADGSWSEPNAGIPEGVTNLVAKRDQRTTAYVAWSLAQAGVSRDRLAKAAAWLRAHPAPSGDRYGLALSALALSSIDPGDTVARAQLRQLVGAGGTGALRLDAGPDQGLLHGGGESLDTELSALATLAAAHGRAPAAARLGAGLVEARQGEGGWGTTQATVLSLQALLALAGTRPMPAAVDVAVELDGRRVGTARLREGATAPAIVAVPSLSAGAHEVALRALSPDAPPLLFDAAARYEEDWERRPVEQGLGIAVSIPRTMMQIDESRAMRVRVQNDAPARVDMLMARIGVPAGFEVDTGTLVTLRERGVVSMVEDGGRTVDVYLSRLERGASLELPLRLVARHPGRVVVPASTIYAYYEPELSGTSPPFALTVVRP